MDLIVALELNITSDQLCLLFDHYIVLPIRLKQYTNDTPYCSEFPSMLLVRRTDLISLKINILSLVGFAARRELLKCSSIVDLM